MNAKARKNSDKKPLTGRTVLLMFLMFFVTVSCVDALFVYYAVGTHSGVVTAQPYEKGLAYNTTLEQAKAQENLNIQDKASYHGGVLRWEMRDKDDKPMDGLTMVVRMVRPVDDGHDFDIILQGAGNGVYEAKTEVPLKGQWMARMETTWQQQAYKSSYSFVTE